MFADMKSMVIKAWRERYALLAINCMNLESARAAVRVAEKHRADYSQPVSGASVALSGDDGGGGSQGTGGGGERTRDVKSRSRQRPDKNTSGFPRRI